MGVASRDITSCAKSMRLAAARSPLADPDDTRAGLR